MRLTPTLLLVLFAAISLTQTPDAPPSPSDNCFAVSILPSAAGEVKVQYIHLRSDCAPPDAIQVFVARPVGEDRLQALDNGFAFLPIAVGAAAPPIRCSGLTDGAYRFVVRPSTGAARDGNDPLFQLPGPYAGKYFESPLFVAGQAALDGLPAIFQGMPSADAGTLDGSHLTFPLHLGGRTVTAVLYQVTDTAVRMARLELSGDSASLDLPPDFSPADEVFVHLINRESGASADYRVWAPAAGSL